eukprot:Pgem_evm1s5227
MNTLSKKIDLSKCNAEVNLVKKLDHPRDSFKGVYEHKYYGKGKVFVEEEDKLRFKYGVAESEMIYVGNLTFSVNMLETEVIVIFNEDFSELTLYQHWAKTG